ncbi:MAG: response regulator [Elusimicrobiota bacterium]|jgi:two-component system chemotaxis response regulator CheY
MGAHVLIADDSAAMRALIMRYLKMAGLPIESFQEAEDGKAALRLLEGGGLDLAIVDIGMPGMNGLDLLEQVRKNPAIARTAFIFASCESNPARIEEFLKTGVGFVHKPIIPNELVDAVQTALKTLPH